MAKTNATEAKPAFVFFNCDDSKSESSMNIFWENNRTIYRDLKGTRKILWEKVQNEVDAGRIHIDENNLDTVKGLILDGDPTEAGKYMQNGAIVKVNCF